MAHGKVTRPRLAGWGHPLVSHSPSGTIRPCWAMSEAQDNMPNLSSAFWASGHLIQLNILLAKPSYMAKVKMKRPNSIHGIDEGRKWVFLNNNPPHENRGQNTKRSREYPSDFFLQLAFFFSYSWIFQDPGRVPSAWLGVTSMSRLDRTANKAWLLPLPEEPRQRLEGIAGGTHFRGDIRFEPCVLACQLPGCDWRRPCDLCPRSHPPRG